MSYDHASIQTGFPEYEVDVTSLGEGGFKVAYPARRDSESFVLKVVKEPLSPEFVTTTGDAADEPEEATLPERVRREILGMKAVENAHVAKILLGPEVRQLGSEMHVCYTEPLYPNGSLEERLKAGPLSGQEVKMLMRGVLDGVAALAEQDIVHRDIKPENIVFDVNGEPVLLDLGIALFLELDSITGSGASSPKTQRYAAPEQFQRRRVAKPDSRTDMFLVGMVAFEALTGRHPFRPETASDLADYVDRLNTHKYDEDSLAAVDNEEDLKQLILRLLRPSPNQRFRTVALAIATLEELS